MAEWLSEVVAAALNDDEVGLQVGVRDSGGADDSVEGVSAFVGAAGGEEPCPVAGEGGEEPRAMAATSPIRAGTAVRFIVVLPVVDTEGQTCDPA